VITRSPSIGAGREHDVLAGVRRAVDGDLARAGELAGALDDGDAAALDQAREALEEARDDAVLVGVHAGHVDALEAGPDAELLGVAGLVGDLGGVQQRLGRDAADVEAGAPEVALLDQAHGQPELGRPERAGVATGAGTEDENVEVGIGHESHPCTSRQRVHTEVPTLE
jgi:hypothetical protein